MQGDDVRQHYGHARGCGGLSQNYIFYEKINLATMIPGAISNYSPEHGVAVKPVGC
jgi:hypothetical protein